MADPAQLITNERIKLRANALDRASTAMFAVGALAPSVAGHPVDQPFLRFGIYTALAVYLHLVATKLLGGLRA